MPRIDPRQGEHAREQLTGHESAFSSTSTLKQRAAERFRDTTVLTHAGKTRIISSSFARYFVAVIAVAIAFSIRWAIVRQYGELPHYITFYPAVLIVAMLGDVWAGLLATALSAVVAMYWILQPLGSFSIQSLSDAIGLAIFCTMGICVSAVAELYHRNHEKLAAFQTEEAVRNESRKADEERKLTEATCAERQRLFNVLETLPTMLCLLTPDHYVAWANRSFRERFGEPLGRHCYEYCFGLTQPCDFCETYSVLRTGRPHHWGITCADGGVLDVYDFPFTDVDGSPLILQMEADITERKRVEAELEAHRHHLQELVKERTSQLEAANAQLRAEISDRKLAEETLRKSQQQNEFLAGLIHASSQPLGVGYPDGRVGLVNRAFEQLIGYSAEELRSVDWAKMLTPPEWLASEEEKLAELHRTGKPVRYEKEFIRKDGTRVPVELLVQLVVDSEGTPQHYFAFVTDITERKRAEDALLRSERLASVGRVAAAIAHEINNPLEAVTNVLFLAKSQGNLPEAARQYLETADEELKRITHITQQSLGFYREPAAPASTSVIAVLESALNLLKSKIRTKNAIVEKQWGEDVQITAMAGELRQVFSNFLVNSLDAIDQNGLIRLRVSAGASPDGRRHVRITVADNGKGISAETRQHLFEPFFTTKGAVGTGLGLWVSKQIIDKHGGTIRLRSSNDGKRRGTVVSVVLPTEPVPNDVREQAIGA